MAMFHEFLLSTLAIYDPHTCVKMN